MFKAINIIVNGRVREWDFAPLSTHLQRNISLREHVQNNLDGVIIIVEGTKTRI